LWGEEEERRKGGRIIEKEREEWSRE